MSVLNGSYHPNRPGASRLSEARPYLIDGKPVTAEIGGGFLSVFVGTEMILDAEIPTDMWDRSQVNPYVQEVARRYEERISQFRHAEFMAEDINVQNDVTEGNIMAGAENPFKLTREEFEEAHEPSMAERAGYRQARMEIARINLETLLNVHGHAMPDAGIRLVLETIDSLRRINP